MNERDETTTCMPSRACQPFLYAFTMFGLDLNFWDKLRLPRKLTRDLLWGLFIWITLSVSSTTLGLIAQEWRRKRALGRIPPRPIEIRSEEVVDGVIGLIGMSHAWPGAFVVADFGLNAGNTPLLRINSLSDALGVEIMVRQNVIADYTNGRAKQRWDVAQVGANVSFSIQEDPSRIV